MPTPLNSFFRQQSLALSDNTRLNLRGGTFNYAQWFVNISWLTTLGTGAALNAALPGGATTWSGAIGTAFYTGTTFSNIYQNQQISTATDNITMMFRIYIVTLVANQNQYCFYNGNPGATGYGIRYDGTTTGNQQFNMLLGGIIAVKAGPTLSANQWYHVALRRSGGVWTLWVNGVSYALNSTNPNTPNNFACIGGWTSTIPNDFARAYFTDIVFYNGAFSDAEIQRYATAPFI